MSTATTTATTTQAEYFYDALVSKYPGLATGIFQFSVTPYPATWADGTGWSDYSSATVTSETVNGFYTPGSGFFNSYQSLIMALKVPDPKKDPNYLSTLKNFNDANNVYNTALTAAHQAYSTWKAMNTDSSGNATPFDTWLQSIDGASFDSNLTQLAAQAKSYSDALQRIRSTMSFPYSQATQDLTLDQITVTAPNGTAMTVPRFGMGGNLAQDVATWDQMGDQDWGLDITLTGTDTVTSKWKVLYSQQVEQKCFTTSTENAVNVNRIITDEQYSLRLRAKGASSYQIQRGNWYHPTVVNPNVELEPSGDVTSAMLFGPDGPLHLVPDAFFVMYKPEMTLTVTTTTYDQYIDGKAGGSVNWLDIFGLRFDVSQGSGIKVDKGPTPTTVHMPMPEGAVPQIVGLQSKDTFLPN